MWRSGSVSVLGIEGHRFESYHSDDDDIAKWLKPWNHNPLIKGSTPFIVNFIYKCLYNI